MDELTMLVQLAGGESEAVRRLRAAGLRRARDIALADPDELRTRSGLSAAASRRLIRAARELLAPADRRKGSALSRALTALPATGSSGAPPRSSDAAAARPRKMAGGAPGARAGQGVSREESSALAGEAPGQERVSRSFWRFG